MTFKVTDNQYDRLS